MLLIPQLEELRQRDPVMYEICKKMVGAINSTARQVNVDPVNPIERPTAIDSLSVTAADGIFDIQITDTSDVRRGIWYFAEYSADSGFSDAKVVLMGPSRNHRVQLGNLTLYWRAYSQYLGSDASDPVMFGAPTAVVGGGTLAGPTPQTSTGTGSGGTGFGDSYYQESTSDSDRALIL